jgi:hypothetical protein
MAIAGFSFEVYERSKMKIRKCNSRMKNYRLPLSVRMLEAKILEISSKSRNSPFTSPSFALPVSFNSDNHTLLSFADLRDVVK